MRSDDDEPVDRVDKTGALDPQALREAREFLARERMRSVMILAGAVCLVSAGFLLAGWMALAIAGVLLLCGGIHGALKDTPPKVKP
jgi:hypothetical protein